MFDTTEIRTTPTGSIDPVLQIRRSNAALSTEDRSYWTGASKSERLIELLETRERFDAEILRLTGEWERDRAWEIDGSLSPRSWLTRNTPLAGGEAQRLVRNARIVAEHEPVATGLADGEITTQHVEAMGRVMSGDRLPLLGEHAPVLVDQASKLPVEDFTKVMHHWASLADDELAKQEYAEKWERRHVHASVGLDGWVNGDFYLDPVFGAQFLSALDHEAPPDPEDAPDGPRTLSQRRADAPTDIFNMHINGGRPGSNPPNVSTVIDVASLLGETPQMATTRCEIEGVGGVTRTVLDQMCCEARFTRFIMARSSEILDMGRASRFPTKAQRRAMMVRDRHCRFPGCDRKPQWCDIHHIDGWVESLGETKIDNLILLCRRHHTVVHNSRWAIKRTADGEFEFIYPARGP